MLMGLAIFVPLLVFSLLYLNPKMGISAITTLMVSVFIVALCLVSLFGFFIRTKLSNNENLFTTFRASTRQAFLFALFIIIILGLAAIKLLTWWDSLLLALSLILFEIYFISNKETKI
jgi:amino acid transporter